MVTSYLATVKGSTCGGESGCGFSGKWSFKIQKLYV